MSAERSPNPLELVRQWVDKAENDLLNAEHTLDLGAAAPLDTICFHVQQCVEKYLKAVLTWYGIGVPRTHDIAVIVDLLPEPDAAHLTALEQERLTDYATVTRYPGGYEPITLEEAREAVGIAQRARECLRALLPHAALSEGGG